jgi:DNA-binding transcriptional regulator YiaG
MEREIEAEVRNRPMPSPVDFAPPRMRAPALSMADYVERREGATEIGKLSAEAIVREYEAAAKDIEAMGGELIERVKQCEEMTRDAFAVTMEMKETAARYREEAKHIFLQIENCSLATAEVQTCTELMEKIAAPPTVKPVPPSAGDHDVFKKPINRPGRRCSS